MMILAVMQKLLEHSSVGGVISNNQILDAFRKKKTPTSKRHLRTLAAKGEMCAKTINLLGTRNKV